MRIAVIGDSISTRNNGASAVCWPRLLGQMIEDGGVFNIEVRNYSVPGLTWRTAKTPTKGWLIGGLSPLQAATADGFDLLLVCLGVNDGITQMLWQTHRGSPLSLQPMPTSYAKTCTTLLAKIMRW